MSSSTSCSSWSPRSSSESPARRGSSRPGRFPWTSSHRATLADTRRIGDVVLLRYALSDRFHDGCAAVRVGRGPLRSLVKGRRMDPRIRSEGAPEAARTRAATIAAFATLAAAPLIAGALTTGTPAALLSLPAESIAVVLILLALPGTRRSARVVAGAFGVVVVLATVVAALDLGFEATIDRAFSLAEDGPALVSAFGVVRRRDRHGERVPRRRGDRRRARRRGPSRSRRRRCAPDAWRRAPVAPAGSPRRRWRPTWIVAALVGAQLLPGVPVAAADATATLAATSAQTAAGIREQAAFERALASDRLRSGERACSRRSRARTSSSRSSRATAGSRSRTPPSRSACSQVLQEGGAQLARDGYSAQSAFLTSPTFGGVSWLAHSTLQSGVWVDSQQKYDRLLSSDRFTLTRAFDDAGWRTVSVVPSNHEPWTARHVLLRVRRPSSIRATWATAGPSFSYALVPDQYTWQHFHDRELAGPHSPVMAEIDFVSSHTPWTPVPQLVPWTAIGDGSVFDPQPDEGLAPVRGVARPAAGAGRCTASRCSTRSARCSRSCTRTISRISSSWWSAITSRRGS